MAKILLQIFSIHIESYYHAYNLLCHEHTHGNKSNVNWYSRNEIEKLRKKWSMKETTMEVYVEYLYFNLVSRINKSFTKSKPRMIQQLKIMDAKARLFETGAWIPREFHH